MNVLFLFPHQLFLLDLDFLKSFDCVYLIEHSLFFGDKKYFFNFHKQKLILHRASMKAYFDSLPVKSKKYIEYDGSCFVSDFELEVSKVTVFDVVDYELNKRLNTLSKRLGCELEVLDTPMFLESKSDLEKFFAGKKTYNQTAFYRYMRKKYNVLIEPDGSFVGGKLTYDLNNRKKLPKGHVPANSLTINKNEYVIEAMNFVKSRFADNPGEVLSFNYPVTREQALEVLEYFLQYKFELFGPYEDAISKNYTFVYHSLLSSSLNIGLITPKEVLDSALRFYEKNNILIDSVEGFVRQIMGWREFMRAMYELTGVSARNANFFKSQNTLDSEFWTAQTGLLPVDVSIRRALDNAYCHHIERLMVLGSVMCLMEIEPNQIYKWFMEFFIDAYDWVMVPNVYSMSQFADGGVLTTKPYISGSNYILKMSDFSKGEWCEVWDALYWRFIDKHRDFFVTNPRLNLMVSLFDKKSDLQKNHLAKSLENFKLNKNLTW